jgi:hypothetical protein
MRRVLLPALELLERIEPGVGIVQGDDEAQVNLVAGGVVEEAAALGTAGERPAERVDDQALLVQGGIDGPDFLDADAIVLRVAVAPQLETVASAACRGWPRQPSAKMV